MKRGSMLMTCICAMWIAALLPTLVSAQSVAGDEEKIRALLQAQVEAWNRSDIEGFMQGYWKSGELQFLSDKGLTYGWESTLDRYKKRYPDKTAMGHLTFDIRDLSERSQTVYTVVGEYRLKRTELEDLRGMFMLVVQKIMGSWKIVADSTH